MVENLLDIHWWHWCLFIAAVFVGLFLDLVVFHRKEHAPSIRESLYWSVFWIGLALLFNAYVWWWGYHLHGTSEAGVKFLTAYVVEKSLSVDNLFVFAVIFRYFGVHIRYQHRILFWGILGAIVTRGLFILAGVELIRAFEWLIAVFGLFLCYTGAKLAFASGEEVHPEKNFILRFARRIMRITPEVRYDRFLVRRDRVLYATPALLVLLVVESTDVLFAVDSIPAVLGISRDPFIVYSSNVGAILGLRALYFLLAGVLERFRYLHYGLAVVLVFIGLKMVAEYAAVTFTNHHGHLIDPWVSLAIVGGILGASLLPTLFTKPGASSDDVDQETRQE